MIANYFIKSVIFPLYMIFFLNELFMQIKIYIHLCVLIPAFKNENVNVKAFTTFISAFDVR